MVVPIEEKSRIKREKKASSCSSLPAKYISWWYFFVILQLHESLLSQSLPQSQPRDPSYEKILNNVIWILDMIQQRPQAACMFLPVFQYLSSWGSAPLCTLGGFSYMHLHVCPWVFVTHAVFPRDKTAAFTPGKQWLEECLILCRAPLCSHS